MNWISRYFERRREEAVEARVHQLRLLQGVLTALESIHESTAKESSTNASALVEIAKAMTAQAQGFSEWMKCFQTAGAPTSSVVRDEDEYREEQQRLLDSGLPADMLALPEEYRLAWVMANDPNLIAD